MERKIEFFDTTLRDGEQSPGCSMNLDEKLRLATAIQELGVDVIEAGFPIASDGDFEAVREVAKICDEVVVAGLARTTDIDIERAANALECARRPRIHTFVATSDIHLVYKLKKTRDEVLEMTRSAIRKAKSYTDDIEFSAEDATRSDPEYICEVFRVAVEEGATVLNIPDTVGYALPGEFGDLVRKVRDEVVRDNDVSISVHCHNDLGLAVANSIEAVKAGATQVECTINGIGERAGNASLEEIAMITKVRSDEMKVSHNVDTEKLYKTSRTLASIISFDVQPNKAIVGMNAFAHEAGIHQHGVLSNPLCYEIMTPESVGAPESSLVLGKHSGRHALAARLEVLGYDTDDIELGEVYDSFTNLADKKKNIYDQDLISIMSTRREAIAA